jgi:hypothetical protein
MKVKDLIEVYSDKLKKGGVNWSPGIMRDLIKSLEPFKN